VDIQIWSQGFRGYYDIEPTAGLQCVHGNTADVIYSWAIHGYNFWTYELGTVPAFSGPCQFCKTYCAKMKILCNSILS
jgi:hypothetical protein